MGLTSYQLRSHVALLLFSLLTSAALADVALPKVLTSNMLLQRDTAVRIWGTAAADENITVTFAGQTHTTRASPQGTWHINLDPMPANAQGRDMVIAANNTITLTNILVGDVWVCSGQSNMEYPLRRPAHYKGPPAGQPDPTAHALANGPYPGIRLFKVQKVLSPGDVTTDGWQTADEEALAKFSALAFFFAQKVHANTGIPIGLIDSSWGGTRIEVWTPSDAYNRFSDLSGVPTTRPLFVDNSPVGRHFDRMIKPLTPFAIKGFLWYQGESNCIIAETDRYTEKQRALIRSWRTAWSNETAPFYYVQIAPYHYSKRKQVPLLLRDLLPRFWEAQADALDLPHTAMVVTTDMTDTLSDIHPYNKWDIGQRMALVALARDYGKSDVVYRSPTYQGSTVNQSAMLVRFENTGGSLKTSDGKPPTDFLIAGPDGTFQPASAEIISADTISLTHPSITQPTAVRFAWDEAAHPNLRGGTGLPVMPFRSDRPSAAN